LPHCPVQPDNSAENDLAVTRYLEIGTALARQVRAGDLAPGSELPAVREHARLLGATSSTIVRAHRWLADGGVITLADRRRARVATDGPVAAARLLESDRVFRLAGSDDPALQLLLAHVGPAVVPVGTRGSFQGSPTPPWVCAPGSPTSGSTSCPWPGSPTTSPSPGTSSAPPARSAQPSPTPHCTPRSGRSAATTSPTPAPSTPSTAAMRIRDRPSRAATVAARPDRAGACAGPGSAAPPAPLGVG